MTRCAVFLALVVLVFAACAVTDGDGLPGVRERVAALEAAAELRHSPEGGGGSLWLYGGGGTGVLAALYGLWRLLGRDGAAAAPVTAETP